MKMPTYLLVNLLTISVPFVFSFHRKLRFSDTWFAFWPATLITTAIFVAWDILFTSWGVWGFRDQHLLGLELFGLPLEEWLFFICIPYACVFTYACLKTLLEKDYLGSFAKPLTLGLSVLLFVIAVLNLGKVYTSVTFLATVLFLLTHLFFFKSQYLGRFYLVYFVLLLPFLIVNGVLTGSFIEGEVVWYNTAENLGIRVFTIPLEDFVYALLLILVNVSFYEYFLSKRANISNVFKT